MEICANNKCNNLFDKVKHNQLYCCRKCRVEVASKIEIITKKSYKYGKKCRLKTKKKFIEMYGGKCVNCDENEKIFLTLDHVDNDGFIDRKKKLSSYATYRKALEKYNSAKYQLLCYNCNCAKKLNNGKLIPHISLVSAIDKIVITTKDFNSPFDPDSSSWNTSNRGG